MSYSSVRTARDAVLAVQAQAAAAVTTASAVFRTATATAQDLGALVSTLTTVASTIRAIRTDLDETDMAALQRYDDAAVTLALWGWERGVRRALVLTEAQVQAVLAVAVELQSGRALTWYTTRPGDTLQSIAAAYLGGWAEWPRISAANGLKPGPVAAGTALVIPQKV